MLQKNNLDINQIEIITFYKFCELPNAWGLRKNILDFCNGNEIKGTILLGLEGVNATISGTPDKIEKFKIFFATQNANFQNIIYKSSYYHCHPFQRMKVKVKPEIVTLGQGEIDIENKVGEYIKPKDWDDFISQDDVIVIDTRNIYEVEIGTFKGAINPQTENFRDFPEWAKVNIKDPNVKIAMFCTGGIRCEKSTTYLKEIGFPNVFHLKGGILGYFAETKNKNNMWIGNCFVFDDRVTVDDHLHPKEVKCKKCNKALTTEEIKYGWHESGQVCEDCR